MKHLTKILFMAISVATLTQNIQAQTNTFPSSGSVGIGTTSPSIGDLEITSIGNSAPLTSLDIHTAYNDATGFNAQSVKITNQMDDGVTFSPTDPENYYIFSVWREWMHGGTVTNTENFFNIDMWGDAQFSKSLVVSNSLSANDVIAYNDASINNNLTVNNDATISNNLTTNDATINNDLTVNNNLKINSLSTGSNKMAVLSASGDFSAWDLPSLDLSGTTLSLKSGTTTLSSVILPGDNLGNHTATNTLNMNNHDISNIADIDVGGIIDATGNITTLSDLFVYGTAYCTAGAWSSDKRFKKSIQNITDIKERLFSVIPYTYYFRADKFKNRKFDDLPHYGVIAQELQGIFPELVKQDKEGYLSVNYIEFIPMLLQVLKEEDQQIKEQQTQINQLTEQLALLTEKVNAIAQTPTGTPGTSTQNIKSVLEQNVPNPFNAETRIAYNIVEKYSKAFIGIYDLSGKEIKQIPLNTAKGEVVLPANNLTPGMYVYSLLVDNQLIDSKKMVIME